VHHADAVDSSANIAHNPPGNAAGKTKLLQDNQASSVYFNNQQVKQQEHFSKTTRESGTGTSHAISRDPVNSSLEDLKLQNKLLREQFQSMINRSNTDN